MNERRPLTRFPAFGSGASSTVLSHSSIKTKMKIKSPVPENMLI